MKRGESRSKNRLERKTIEKNRRIRMKSLSFKLVSLIPHRNLSKPKEFLSFLDQIEEAAAYIKISRERIEELKRRKAQLMQNIAANNIGGPIRKQLPILTVKELGIGVEVVLISGLNKTFMLGQVITIIEQEAAQVFTVNIARVADNIIHTLHAQVKISRVGVDTSRIRDRIHEMISCSL